MKKILGLTFILFLTIGTYGQWLQQSSGTTNTLEDVYFLNQDTGFAVGNSKILKTVDGGLNWQITSINNCFIRSVCFANTTNGFAVGYDMTTNKSTIIKTTDGGGIWLNSNLAISSILSDIYFVDSNTGFFVGGDGVAYRTTNGGNTWDSLSTGATGTLQSVFFINNLKGFIVGKSNNMSVILKTTDGGNTWSNAVAPPTTFLQGIFFPSALIGYAVGWNGEILKTTDGGDNWISQTAAAIYGNLDVFFVDNNTGYIVGGTETFAGIQKTTDGGQTWSEQLTSVNNGLMGVYFPTHTIGYCVGSGGTILKTTNGGVTAISDYRNNEYSIITYPNPFVDELTIKTDNVDMLNASIYDLNGKLIFYRDNLMNSEKINLSEINNGTYFLVIETKHDKIIKQIIKN